MAIRVDLSGKKFGRLLVLEYAGQDKKQRSQWKCLCDCGTVKILGGQTMSRPKKPILSCGCLRVEWQTRFSRLDPRKPTINRAYSGFLSSARMRKIPVEISFDDWFVLATQNCHYCGDTPKNYSKPIATKVCNTEIFYYNGVDRKNSAGGYTPENCVPCCVDCNRGKMKQSYEDFLTMAGKIYNNRISSKKVAYTGI